MSSVKGPLGFWSFPIINAIMGMIGGGRRNVPALTTSIKAPSVINSEDITWTDWKLS